ncbi:hypothetical protein GCM10018793_20340 [Streptomyces sulfonofaciens]|uniref:Uncharacterized protein n=1 Tax=Streptomyces sulfonofaciens TaxID=68272 RepID=A0A919KWD7_9ACTN|nr:hypothetical protein GCM10018793_20340 [Streptomyces sulfonofaciens]
MVVSRMRSVASLARALSGIGTPAMFSVMAGAFLGSSCLPFSVLGCGRSKGPSRYRTANKPSKTAMARRPPADARQAPVRVVVVKRCRYWVGERPRWRAKARRRLS